MKNWLLWLLAGLVSLVGGALALANPFAATLTVELLAAYTFLLIGVLTLLSAFRDQGWRARIWALIWGGLALLLGVSLLSNPLAGMVSITFLVAVLMLVTGIARVAIAFMPTAQGARAYLLIAGGISIVLSLMIFSNFPWSATVVLGVFLGVELISNGMSLIFVAFERRRGEA